MKVYNCLNKVGQESALDHGPTLDMVGRKLPGGMLEEWVKAMTNAKMLASLSLVRCKSIW